ncbi:MAG: 2-amino-4-hydroxy-6-hydroxymethyldihydropteridine diphosphokinase [Bacteroidia bacterium]|nr:MAG: 2-amino-4-hydroxy-6-hydroxymethyldihydropteridine diphosphokinase [Bacteroidia bacterium]
MFTVFLALGGNQGNRLAYLNKALFYISEMIGDIIHESSIFETEPWGFDDESYFLNKVVMLKTQLLPTEILAQIRIIENLLERKRKTIGYEGRTIDLDILFFNNEIIDSKPELVVPHPHLHERKFVLIPLNEIAPNFIHPVLLKSVKELVYECGDTCEIRHFREN